MEGHGRVDGHATSAWRGPEGKAQADREAADAAMDARAAREGSTVAYDSAQRRDAFARSLEGTASDQEVRGRVLADTGNAKHPREAVTTATGRAPRPRKSRAGNTQHRDRGGLSR